ncbi:MAG: transcriptional activator RfaH [Minwuia sp.]|nr:transcriptional activator RfaH [Minwuia sp.]
MAATEPAERWYLAQLKPNCQRIALRNLDRQGFRTFLPLHDLTTRQGGSFVTRSRPLFPGYVFVAFDLEAGGWSTINNTYGITRLVSFGARPAPVPDDLMAGLLGRCDAAGKLLAAVTVRPGDAVMVTAGAFADFVGRVERIDPDQRVWVLLDLLGRTTRVSLSPDSMRVA